MPHRKTSLPRPYSILVLGLALAAGIALAATQWKIDPAQSKVGFTGTQAGAAFDGVFERYTAEIRFDPQDLPSSRFDVTIDLKSVNTKDKDRDGTIKGPDIFATDRWPTAHYVAEKFTDQGGGKFLAMGKLTLRDVTRDVPLQFTFQADGAGAWLKGSAAVKRLDFGAGQGDWKDTTWVANDVKVNFALRLQH
jgi:polyisoprenoid-binding protein YceI